ncbi:heme-containing dehydratase protein [Xylogone sp. PMI_703]|nr:heme-containing dehydratase protein [Xylogone sp. PMI_703]
MSIEAENRIYPLKQPQDWKPKFPRWMLQLPDEVEHLSICYVGVQANQPFTNDDVNHLKPRISEQQKYAVELVENWLSHGCGAFGPKLWEKFYVESGYDVPETVVWVLYWVNEVTFREALARLNLEEISRSLPTIGLWREAFTVPEERFETVYSGPDYQPGLASLPGASQVPHNFTGYWGAARDRLPASARELFRKEKEPQHPDTEKPTKGKIFCGNNDDVMVHIRSGQFWERCNLEEREAYEANLEPVLRQGMKYVELNAFESGDYGLRFMRNLTTNRLLQAEQTEPILGRQRRETSVAGFYRSLGDLERWASSHQTHHKIFHGVHKHALQFGQGNFKFRSWHEVCILHPGEASFEYVNCEPRTGLLPFVDIPASSHL